MIIIHAERHTHCCTGHVTGCSAHARTVGDKLPASLTAPFEQSYVQNQSIKLPVGKQVLSRMQARSAHVELYTDHETFGPPVRSSLEKSTNKPVSVILGEFQFMMNVKYSQFDKRCAE